MDDIVTNADIRRSQAEQRLGGQSQCAFCPETNPHCIELHHIAGQKYHDQLVSACRTCHRKLSDPQQDHPAQIGTPPSLLEAVGHYLLGLADMLRLVAESLVAFGQQLIGMAQQPTAGVR